MMRRFYCAVFVAMVAFWFASAAHAVDETSYPTTLVDAACTDANDTVSGTATGYLVQYTEDVVGGGANGQCDHDNRILTGALSADTTFGPFVGGKGACIYLFADGNTVTGGDTKWTIDVYMKQPHDGVLQVLEQGTLLTGSVDSVFVLGISTQHGPSIAAKEILTARLPEQFWLTLDLDTATSWAGELSMVRCWF